MIELEIQKTLKNFPSIDILINNAGIVLFDYFKD